jgi:hypothetical protein
VKTHRRVAVAAPATITVSEFATTGFSAVVDEFAASAPVSVTFRGAVVATLTPDETGTVLFDYVNTDPGVAPGDYVFVFDQPSRSMQVVAFTLVADVAPPAGCTTTPATGSAPATISAGAIRSSGLRATATGFIPGETVDVVLGTPSPRATATRSPSTATRHP